MVFIKCFILIFKCAFLDPLSIIAFDVVKHHHILNHFIHFQSKRTFLWEKLINLPLVIMHLIFKTT